MVVDNEDGRMVLFEVFLEGGELASAVGVEDYDEAEFAEFILQELLFERSFPRTGTGLSKRKPYQAGNGERKRTWTFLPSAVRASLRARQEPAASPSALVCVVISTLDDLFISSTAFLKFRLSIRFAS